MPLPHFLILITTVILAAALTVWGMTALGIPLYVLGLVALTGAAVAHLAMRVDP